jgi:Fic family protein
MNEELEDMKKKLGYLSDRNEELDAKAYSLLKTRNELIESIRVPVSQLQNIEYKLKDLSVEKDRLLMEKGKAVEQIIALEDSEKHEEDAEGLYQ